MVVLTSVCATGKLGSSTNKEGAVILCVSRARLLDGRLSGLPGMDKQSNRGESAPELVAPSTSPNGTTKTTRTTSMSQPSLEHVTLMARWRRVWHMSSTSLTFTVSIHISHILKLSQCLLKIPYGTKPILHLSFNICITIDLV
jgi:hypothetical protein